MRKLFLLFAAAACGSWSASAQMTCGTDAVYNQLKEAHPEINKIELELGAAIQEALERKSADPFARVTATTYDVPIVVHIVHDYGTEYVTDNAIYEAVAYWDQVFNAQNTDTSEVIRPFKKYVGNPQIRLRLATKDPSGNPTKGITRRQSYLTSEGSDQAKLDGWPNNQYINVWFVNRFSSDHSGAAAYAYYPSSGAYLPYYDGIIGLATYLNYEKAIPHEFGHVLNLAHTWGSTNDPGMACGDDGVDDTPPTKGHTNCSAANLYDTVCAKGYKKGSIDYPDTVNTQNIMDYAYCQKMFTIGQSDRMRAALTSSVAGRNNLYSASNLTATGALLPSPDLAPTPDFSVERGQYSGGLPTLERSFFLCQNSGTKFVFRNRSWNDTVTSSEWTFSNDATTPTATTITGNLLNQFAIPGWVTITLKATGNNSGSNTITRNAVYVADSTVEKPGYAQYFATPGDTAKWPMFNFYNNQFKWEYYSGSGYKDASCVRYHSFDNRTGTATKTGTPEGDYDDMYTPGFDLAAYGSADLNLGFYTSGAFVSGTTPDDSMQIFVSTTCGTSWARIATLTGTNLINNGKILSDFAPTSASQWKAQTISIPSSYRAGKAFFRFRYWPSARGNNLYFDHFSVSPFATEVNEIKKTNEIRLFPNPTSGDAKLCFTTGSDGNTTIAIRDLTGKTVYSNNVVYPVNTFIEEQISRSLFNASGLYLVTVTSGDKSVTLKLTVQ